MADPVVGLKWDCAFEVDNARVNQAQAELEALYHKKAFAVGRHPVGSGRRPMPMRRPISNPSASWPKVRLRHGAGWWLRWPISGRSGRGRPGSEAVRNYALTQVEYLRTVNDYNMNVAELARLTGELK